ncbi:uncharacterized protein [Odocoileus virginianus]|uniref:Uncharacterized protein n=1 Tax=Odocoileus virginianus TaxID=9874 RepID=A0ABM4H0N8_ODOVR
MACGIPRRKESLTTGLPALPGSSRTSSERGKFDFFLLLAVSKRLLILCAAPLFLCKVGFLAVNSVPISVAFESPSGAKLTWRKEHLCAQKESPRVAERSHAEGGDVSGARRGRRPGEGEAHRRQRVSWSRFESDRGRRSGFRSQQTKRLRSNRPALGEAPATQEAEAQRRRPAPPSAALLPRPAPGPNGREPPILATGRPSNAWSAAAPERAAPYTPRVGGARAQPLIRLQAGREEPARGRGASGLVVPPQASDPLSAVSDACSLRCRAVGTPQRGKKIERTSAGSSSRLQNKECRAQAGGRLGR